MLSRVKKRRWVASSRPDLLVGELALQQCEANAAVGDIGQRHDEEPYVGCRKRREPQERRERVLEVLEDVGGDDHVESIRAELCVEIERLQVSDDHPLAVLSGLSGHLGVDLDPDHRAARARRRASRHVPGRRAEFQNPSIGADQARRSGRASLSGVEVDVELVPGWRRLGRATCSLWLVHDLLRLGR